MGLTLKERGAKIVLEWSDGKVVIDGESVEFYAVGLGAAALPALSLSSENFYDVIAAFEQYHADPE